MCFTAHQAADVSIISVELIEKHISNTDELAVLMFDYNLFLVLELLEIQEEILYLYYMHMYVEIEICR